MSLPYLLFMLFLTPAMSLNGPFDFGVFSYIQAPILLILMFLIYRLLRRAGRRRIFCTIVLIIFYVSFNTITNLLGLRLIKIDHTHDMPITNMIRTFPTDSTLSASEVKNALGPPLTEHTFSDLDYNIPSVITRNLENFNVSKCTIFVYFEKGPYNQRSMNYLVFSGPDNSLIHAKGIAYDKYYKRYWPNKELKATGEPAP